jgi:hypothetical protein
MTQALRRSVEADRPAKRRSGPIDRARELVDELEYRLLHGRLLALLLTPLVLPLRGRSCPTAAGLLASLRTRLELRPELFRSLALVPLRPAARRRRIFRS